MFVCDIPFVKDSGVSPADDLALDASLIVALDCDVPDKAASLEVALDCDVHATDASSEVAFDCDVPTTDASSEVGLDCDVPATDDPSKDEVDLFGSCSVYGGGATYGPVAPQISSYDGSRSCDIDDSTSIKLILFLRRHRCKIHSAYFVNSYFSSQNGRSRRKAICNPFIRNMCNTYTIFCE